MHIETDDLSRPEVHALLQEHLEDMYAWSPPESVHALDAHGHTYRYAMDTPLGEAIAEAIYADTFHSQHILNACWYHGED